MTVSFVEPADPFRFKYTDKDVRQHPELIELAAAYLRQYQGEFDYLRDMKRSLALNGELTTGMVRGVLNCMRHNAAAAVELAKISLPSGTAIPEVRAIESAPSQRKRRKSGDEENCSKRTPHRGHSWTEEGGVYVQCPGIPWKINRHGYSRDAKINSKWKFAKARGGKYLHQLSGEGYCIWFPNEHSDGFYRNPVLVVYTRCRYPSQIESPTLMESVPVDETLTLLGVTECPHCKESE